MSNAIKHLLVGTWHGQEETLSNVQYIVAVQNDSFSVSAIDIHDNEVAQVHGVEWDEEKASLLFCCYWESSGRFSKCKLSSISGDKANFVYQYTDHEILVRSDV